MRKPPAPQGQAALVGKLHVGLVDETTSTYSAKLELPQVYFLKHRFARAIERGDDEHAEIARQLLDRLMNGPVK
jgi:hypothetical protein